MSPQRLLPRTAPIWVHHLRAGGRAGRQTDRHAWEWKLTVDEVIIQAHSPIHEGMSISVGCSGSGGGGGGQGTRPVRVESLSSSELKSLSD